MEQKPYILLVNPKAGYGKSVLPFMNKTTGQDQAHQYIQHITDLFAYYGKPIKSHIISRKSTTEAFLNTLNTDNCEALLVAGGDGTIHSVLPVVLKKSLKLGIIPVGSVNILAKDLGLPMSIKEACECIIKGHLKHIDIGSVDKQYFASMLGIGFDASVIQATKDRLKKRLGLLAYGIAALKVLMSRKSQEIEYKINQRKHSEKASFLLIQNSKYYSGKLCISERSSLDDGTVELITISSSKKSYYLLFMLALILKAVLKVDIFSYLSAIQVRQVKKVTIIKQAIPGFHLDAEYKKESPKSIKLQTKCLSIFC